MHPEVSQFIEGVRGKHPEYFTGTKVLEVGSLDINGSIRYIFHNRQNYIGLDLGPGPGVDVICPIHEYKRPGEFDVVVSTEMLEHDKYWRSSLKQMYENVKPGGMLILTCAGPTRQEHGTTRTTPGDAPFTNDYYMNISIEDFHSELPTNLFSNHLIKYERGNADLYFYGIKRKTNE